MNMNIIVPQEFIDGNFIKNITNTIRAKIVAKKNIPRVDNNATVYKTVNRLISLCKSPVAR